MKFSHALLPVLTTVLAAGAQAAAKVELSFLAPEKYTDVGEGPVDQERNLEILGSHVRKIGEKALADGQTLGIAFDDIDLAGRPKLFHRSSGDYRIITGEADWPRIRLRWLLRTPGKPDRAGDASLSDMNYLWHVRSWRADEPLYYDKRMIDEWFGKTFGPAVDGPAPASAP